MDINKTFLLTTFGVITGISTQLNWAAEYMLENDVDSLVALLVARIIISSVVFPILFIFVSKTLRKLVCKFPIEGNALQRYLKYEHFTYAVFILFALGIFGVLFNSYLVLFIFGVFVTLQVSLLLAPVKKRISNKTGSSAVKSIFLVFFISGFAALVYQVIWQRTLFTVFGVNTESVTVIVSIFMLGLGLGSLFGGYLSKRFSNSLPIVFVVLEISIGVFGIFSLQLIQIIGSVTNGNSLWAISLAVFSLLFLPTLFMGSTLPVLVSYINRYYKNVGSSVGYLYFINTLGSALACFFTVHVFFVLSGLQITSYIAVSANLFAGVFVYLKFVLKSAKVKRFIKSALVPDKDLEYPNSSGIVQTKN